MNTTLVRFRRLPHGEGLDVPGYQSEAASGMDLRAAINAPLLLSPGWSVDVPIGFEIELPPGHEGQVRPRSGLAARHRITVLNTPGTIDSDFRGEIIVMLTNHGREPFVINRGDRIAQLVITPVVRAHVAIAEELSQTARGQNGLGSTGVQ